MQQRRIVEDRHEVRLQRRLPDVRPWNEKFAEACSQKPLVFALTLPLIVISLVFWLIAPITLSLAWWIIYLHRSYVQILPMRYPAINPELNPVTNKKGDGIMLFGHKDSTSPYEKFKEIWGDDDNLRRHMLILGTTGSGKSETLKALFFNALCWSSGFFIADGKADNKLPTDVFTMVRSVGMDDNLLTLNFLLGGKTPEQVRRSRRRRTNKLNFVSSSDADTLIQIGANMLPKVEGESKNWQEKALNLWRATVVALCYKRDTQNFDISVSTLVEYMNLSKIEELYIEGHKEAQQLGEWSHGFISIKTYLDSGCPAYKVDKLLAKHGLDGGGSGGGMPGMPKPPTKPGANEQDSMAFEQHAYRTSQLMPVLNLLDKTYGHIFRDKFPEIDMIDVTLNNRIMTMLIPSLEKSAQEAENLGKLAIACLRVMMARNLGGGVEGSRRELLESKATTAPYPYLVALDELGYYFSDGLAVIFAQARSLGFQMIPAAQDLEKLTEGSRAAEAGAMIANAGIKIFLRIVDPEKTWKLVNAVIGKAWVPMFRRFEIGGFGWKRDSSVDLQEVDRVTMQDMDAMTPGEGFFTANGKATKFRSYYMDGDLKKYKADEFYVLRFLQVRAPSNDEIDATSLPFDTFNDPLVKGERLKMLLSGEAEVYVPGPDDLPPDFIIKAIAEESRRLGKHVPTHLRGIALFCAAQRAIEKAVRGSELDADNTDTSARGGQEWSHQNPDQLDPSDLGDAAAMEDPDDALARGGFPPASSAPSVHHPSHQAAQKHAAALPAPTGEFELGGKLAAARDQESIKDWSELFDVEAGQQVAQEQFAQEPVIAPAMDAMSQSGSPASAGGGVVPSEENDLGDIDLDDLLSDEPIIKRKKAADLVAEQDLIERVSGSTQGTFESLIDPVELFFSSAVQFSVSHKKPDAEKSIEETLAASINETIASTPAQDVKFDWELDELLSATGVSHKEEKQYDGNSNADASHSTANDGAIGLDESALAGLVNIESLLGTPDPQSAARNVEAINAVALAGLMSVGDRNFSSDTDQMLKELEDLCGGSPETK